MKNFFLLILCVLFSFYLKSQSIQKSNKTKVLLLGTFHFDNPGLDVAKFENANILSAKRQEELKEVIAQLKKINPQKIFVEFTPESQSVLDSLYLQYKEGKWKLSANEVYQLGFRLAKDLNLPKIHAVDYGGADFRFDSLIKVLQEEKQFELMQYIQNTIDSIQTSFNKQLKTATLKEIILAENTSASDDLSVGTYFKLLVAGNKNNHVGAYIASEWWRRNMIIYENILKRLDGKEKNILIIFGSSHTALLKEFMKYNDDLEIVDVSAVLN